MSQDISPSVTSVATLCRRSIHLQELSARCRTHDNTKQDEGLRDDLSEEPDGRGAQCPLVITSPAGAGAARREPKPYQSETVRIEVSKWIPYSEDTATAISVTMAEFVLNCEIPQDTQGLDAWVFEVPKSYRGIESAIYTKGEGVDITGTEEWHDIDIYIYDDACNLIAAYGTNNRDENGLVPNDAAYILLNNYHSLAAGPGTASFRLEPWRN